MSRANSPIEPLLSEIQKQSSIILEYLQLATLETLNDAQAELIEKILESAENDLILDFLLDEADHIISHELVFTGRDRMVEQQEALKQKLDKTWVQLTISRSRLDRSGQLPKETLEDAQKQLQKLGLYDGPINGLYGEQTKAAFCKLEEIFHEEWGGTDPTLLMNCKISPEGIFATEGMTSLGDEDIAEIYSKAQLLMLHTWLSKHS